MKLIVEAQRRDVQKIAQAEKAALDAEGERRTAVLLEPAPDATFNDPLRYMTMTLELAQCGNCSE